MGSDATKDHEAFSVAPAPLVRASDVVDLRDDRPASAPPLSLDADRLDAALEAVGVTIDPSTEIRLRLRVQSQPGEQGSTKRIGPDAYRVVIHIADKPTLAGRHLYVVNNSLLGRLRHSSDYGDLRIMPTPAVHTRPGAKIETAEIGIIRSVSELCLP